MPELKQEFSLPAQVPSGDAPTHPTVGLLFDTDRHSLPFTAELAQPLLRSPSGSLSFSTFATVSPMVSSSDDSSHDDHAPDWSG